MFKTLKALTSVAIISALAVPLSISPPPQFSAALPQAAARSTQTAGLHDAPLHASPAMEGVALKSLDTGIEAGELTIPGNTVSFDDGVFTDPMSDTSHMFGYAGITKTDAGYYGPGAILYKTGGAGIASVEIDIANLQKWGMTYQADAALAACEAEYDSKTGTVTPGKRIELVRKVDPAQINDQQNSNLLPTRFVSAALDPGTQYLLLELPQAAFFDGANAYGDFVVSSVKLTDGSVKLPESYVNDVGADLSKLASGSDTSNLQANTFSYDPNNPWTVKTYGSFSYITQKDTAKETAMTYAAPDGKEFDTAYAEEFLYNPASLPFTVWISQDGVSYIQLSGLRDCVAPANTYSGYFEPTTADLTSLPHGVKYLQVRLASYNDGWATRMVTCVALGVNDYAAPGDGEWDQITAPKAAYETIVKADEPITVDGIVETDTSGSPAGEWADAQALAIDGTTDGSGSHAADVFLKYDYDFLYIGAKIRDPTPMINLNTGTNIWNGDCLELFMGLEDLNCTQYPDKQGTMLNSDLQLVLSGGTDYGAQSYLNINGSNSFPVFAMKNTRDSDGKGYTIEAAVPLSALNIPKPWEGADMIMNAVLNDGSSPGRGQWGWTTQNESTKKSRGLWGLATFAQADAPRQNITVSASVSDGTATVSGTDRDAGSRNISLVVRDSAGAVAYIDQVKSSAQGGYSFSFKLRKSGTYTVSVGGEDADEPVPATLVY